MKSITFNIEPELHSRYQALKKKIKFSGFTVKNTVPQFLVDMLEQEEKRNFKNLKKYLG